jgi:tRNA-dihydrouridine synthase
MVHFYLIEEPETAYKLVEKLHNNLNIPVTCKIRIYPELEKTLEYAKNLEKSGVQVNKINYFQILAGNLFLINISAW